MADDQFQYIKLPDGSYGKFNANASDDEIKGHIQQDFPDAFKQATPQHPYLDAATDFGKGILKSGISTMSAADDFAQKHLPAFMTTPIGQAPTAENSARAVATAKQMGTANNTAQSIGKGVGDAAQFLIPGGLEEKAASRLIPTLGKLGSKIATGAIGSGVVNSAQGGSFLGGAAMGAGAPVAAKGIGMAIKGLGGALKAASADAPSLSLMTTRALTKGTPGELLQAALKPGVKYGAGADNMLENSIPHVLASDPSVKGVSGFASASDMARNAAFEPYNNLISPYKRPVGLSEVTPEGLPTDLAEPVPGAEGPFRPSAINATPIANAQMRSIPTMDLIENKATPSTGGMKFIKVSDGEDGTMRMGAQTGGESQGGIVNKTKSLADNYRKEFPIPAIDAAREDANAKLNAFYGKAHGDQNAALSNPETARVKSVGDTSRKLLYPQLEEGAGIPAGSVADMQKKYGLLADVSDIANKREPVFSRHDPVSLGQKIAASAGSNPLTTASKFLTQKFLDKMTNSDALVNTAIDRYQNPLGTPLVARPNLLSQGAMASGNFIKSNPAINSIAKFPFIPLVNNLLKPKN